MAHSRTSIYLQSVCIFAIPASRGGQYANVWFLYPLWCMLCWTSNLLNSTHLCLKHHKQFIFKYFFFFWFVFLLDFLFYTNNQEKTSNTKTYMQLFNSYCVFFIFAFIHFHKLFDWSALVVSVCMFSCVFM